MATIEAAARRPTEVGRRFYLGLSLLMVAVIVGGFSQTVPGDFAPPGIPLLLHIHGAVFTCWVLLVVAQPALVVAGDVRRHRQLGYLGAALAAAMVALALAATVVAVRIHMMPPAFPPAAFLVMNGLNAICFGALVAAGVAMRRKPEWHKRLMICATGAILGPGLGRFLPMGAMGPAAPFVMFAVNDIILFIGPLADLLVRRRLHPAYLWGVGAVLLTEAAIPPIAMSPLGATMLRLATGG
jgi:hypothetical protein